jgi:hypothetical protein
MVSSCGSVCARGVEGLGAVMLLWSDVLLTWRARVLASPMWLYSTVSGWRAGLGSCTGDGVGRDASLSVVAAAVVGGEVRIDLRLRSGNGVWGAVAEDTCMAFRRWTGWSWCRSAVATAGGEERFAVVIMGVSSAYT